MEAYSPYDNVQARDYPSILVTAGRLACARWLDGCVAGWLDGWVVAWLDGCVAGFVVCGWMAGQWRVGVLLGGRVSEGEWLS